MKQKVVGHDNQGRPYCRACGRVYETEAQVYGHVPHCKGVAGLVERLRGTPTPTPTPTGTPTGDEVTQHRLLQLENEVAVLRQHLANHMEHLEMQRSSWSWGVVVAAVVFGGLIGFGLARDACSCEAQKAKAGGLGGVGDKVLGKVASRLADRLVDRVL